MPVVIAMIPARLGSQRLKQKNLLELGGQPIVARAALKAKSLGIFDDVWMNSESDVIGQIASEIGVNFHRRPEALGSNTATSEDFVAEFLEKHPCDYLVQLHSIAPLLTGEEIRSFTSLLLEGRFDTLLSGTNEQIQCMIGEEPINFSKTAMDATQELAPVQRISWSITGWNSKSYLESYRSKACATFNGRIGFFPLKRPSGIVIKYEEDFNMVEALFAAGIGTD